MTGSRPKGRPRKYAERRVSLSVRLQASTYDVIKKAAAESGRSISEEIERRVERSWEHRELIREIALLLGKQGAGE